MRALATRFLLAAAGGGLGFGACELWARGRYGTPLPERVPLLEVQANAWRGWEMVPDLDHYTYLERVRINSIGLRGDDLAPKRPGELRVLCLGDSLIYGQGVGEDDTLPAALEEALPPESRPVVINGGLRAYATHQELGMLEELGERIAADVVLLCWYWNDVDERDIERTHAKLEASGPIVFDLGSPWSTRLRISWHLRQLLRRSALLNHLHEQFRMGPWEQWSEAYRAAGIERLDRYLERFQALCSEQGAELRVVLMPDPGGIMGGAVSTDLSSRGAQLFEERGLPFLDLRPTMAAWMAEHGSAPILPFDGHFNGDGNRLLAGAIADWLRPE